MYLFLFLLASCSLENSPTLPTADKQIVVSGLPPDPGAGNLTGKILGTVTQQALAGVQVTIDSTSTISGSDGSFLLKHVGNGYLAVTISGKNVYQRVSMVNTAAGRSVLLDAIEKQSAFHLDFYRELARGSHPAESGLFAIQRWTGPTPPTIYIDTNAAATEAGLVSSDNQERLRKVIERMVPVLSGDVYKAAPIQNRSFPSYDFDDIPENSIVISFDDSLYHRGAMGVTFTEPNFTSKATASLRKAWIFVLHNEQYYQQGGVGYEELCAHELGHSFGYRHTSLLPSIMRKNGAYGGLFSEHDRLHMRVMYKRPFGNLDIDTDALPGVMPRARNSGRQMFIERSPEAPESQELLMELKHTTGLVSEFLSHSPDLRMLNE